MDDIDLQKLMFRPICSNAEIDRIFNVSGGRDYLLKLRAETIVDHMRLFRVYRNKAIRIGGAWSLENAFDDIPYRKVLDCLPKDARDACDTVVYGDVFSNDPNGMIFSTQYGPIVTISESLRFFLKFAHLVLLDFSGEVPKHVQFNGLRISMRVMLKTEAMDFFMDPRGILPKNIAQAIHEPIPLQLQFIAGHEFAHHLLGHLSTASVKEQALFRAISERDLEYGLEKVYNISQQNEFDADLAAINLPNYPQELKGKMLEAALLWFSAIELYEGVCDVMFPRTASTYKSHPDARDRYEQLLTNVKAPPNFDTKIWKEFPKYIQHLIKWLREDVSLNFETYEMYGSIYLDAPDTEWRGRALVDRVDYY